MNDRPAGRAERRASSLACVPTVREEAVAAGDVTGGLGLNAPIASHRKSDSDHDAALPAKRASRVAAALRSGESDEDHGMQGAVTGACDGGIGTLRLARGTR